MNTENTEHRSQNTLLFVWKSH